MTKTDARREIRSCARFDHAGKRDYCNTAAVLAGWMNRSVVTSIAVATLGLDEAGDVYAAAREALTVSDGQSSV